VLRGVCVECFYIVNVVSVFVLCVYVCVMSLELSEYICACVWCVCILSVYVFV